MEQLFNPIIFSLIMTVIFAVYNGWKIYELKNDLPEWPKKHKYVGWSILGLMFAYTVGAMFLGNPSIAIFTFLLLLAWDTFCNKWIRLKRAGDYTEAKRYSKYWHGIGLSARILWSAGAFIAILLAPTALLSGWAYIWLALSVNVLYDLIINIIVPAFKTFHVDTPPWSFNYWAVNKVLGGHAWLFWVIKLLVITSGIILLI